MLNRFREIASQCLDIESALDAISAEVIVQLDSYTKKLKGKTEIYDAVDSIDKNVKRMSPFLDLDYEPNFELGSWYKLNGTYLSLYLTAPLVPKIKRHPIGDRRCYNGGLLRYISGMAVHADKILMRAEQRIKDMPRSKEEFWAEFCPDSTTPGRLTYYTTKNGIYAVATIWNSDNEIYERRLSKHIELK